MYLHENEAELNQMVEVVAASIGQPATHVIKDYYVTMMLREILSRNEELVFKGGTALSKCYGLIKRFSEDIDLGMEKEKTTQKERKEIKQAIGDAAKALGLEIPGFDKKWSKNKFNRYEIPLPQDYSKSAVTNILLVETAVMTPITPTEVRQVSSLIGDYLSSVGQEELIKKYSLEPFTVKVTSLARSLSDKIYAICDYYLEDKDLEKPSRHIYDIHKLLSRVKLNDELRELIVQVGLERRCSKLTCPSAEEDVVLAEVLHAIVDDEPYRSGYENTTTKLLNSGENVLYDTAIKSVEEIIAFLEQE